MTREEAIAFLHEIKMNLGFLQARSRQLQYSMDERLQAKVQWVLYVTASSGVEHPPAQIQIPPCLLKFSLRKNTVAL
jgi:hypothetical protein